MHVVYMCDNGLFTRLLVVKHSNYGHLSSDEECATQVVDMDISPLYIPSVSSVTTSSSSGGISDSGKITHPRVTIVGTYIMYWESFEEENFCKFLVLFCCILG